MNSTVFHWPDHIKTVFELSQGRLSNRRENAEDEVKKKVHLFEEKLDKYYKEIESFRKKEVNDIVVAIIRLDCNNKSANASFL